MLLLVVPGEDHAHCLAEAVVQEIKRLFCFGERKTVADEWFDLIRPGCEALHRFISRSPPDRFQLDVVPANQHLSLNRAAIERKWLLVVEADEMDASELARHRYGLRKRFHSSRTADAL